MGKIEVRAGIFGGLYHVREGDKWACVYINGGAWVSKSESCTEELWNSLSPVTDQEEIDAVLSYIPPSGNTSWETV